MSDFDVSLVEERRLYSMNALSRPTIYTDQEKDEMRYPCDIIFEGKLSIARYSVLFAGSHTYNGFFTDEKDTLIYTDGFCSYAALKEMKFVVSASELVYEFCTSADSSSIDNIDAARRHVMAVLEFKAKEFKPYVVDSVDAVLISGDVPGMPVTVVCGKGIESVYSLSRKRPEGLPIE